MSEYFEALNPERPMNLAQASHGPATFKHGSQPAVTPEELAALPNDLKHCFDLLKEAEAMPDKTKDQRIARNARLRIVKRKCFLLQQTPAAPTIDADDLARPNERNLRILAKDRARIERIAANQ